MVTISKSTLKNLRKEIGAGRVIPDIYLKILGAENIRLLLVFAEQRSNSVFPEQVRVFLKAVIPQGDSPNQLTSHRQGAREKGALRQFSKSQKSTNSGNEGFQSSRRKKGKRAKVRQDKIVVSNATLQKMISANSRPAVVFETSGQIVFVGGNASLPVQNDKAANLPSD